MSSQVTRVARPSWFIRDHVIPPRMSVSEAARLLDVSRSTLSKLLNGRSSLSPQMALKLEKASGNDRQELSSDARLDESGGLSIMFTPPNPTDSAARARFCFLGKGIDEEIDRIIDESTYENKKTLDWLASKDQNNDSKKKACLLNILARLAAIDYKLIKQVESVKHYENNRVHLKVKNGFVYTMQNCGCFKKGLRGGFFLRPHKKLYCTAGIDRTERKSKKYKLISFRENRSGYSLQIVTAKPNDTEKYLKYIDVDMDLANPLKVLPFGFLRHFYHIVTRKRVNHLAQKSYDKIYKKSDGTKQFCYFELRENSEG